MSSVNEKQNNFFNFRTHYKIAHNGYPIYRFLCFARQTVGTKKHTVEDPVFHGVFSFHCLQRSVSAAKALVCPAAASAAEPPSETNSVN
jgi:hypothetical protein